MISEVKLLSAELSNISHPWAIVGGANLVCRSCSKSAADIDIITTKEGSSFIFLRLKKYAVCELEWSQSSNIKSYYFSAFFHSLKIEVMGDPINKINGAWVVNNGWKNSIEKTHVGDAMVPLTSLAYEKEINIALGNYQRVAEIEKCITKPYT